MRFKKSAFFSFFVAFILLSTYIVLGATIEDFPSIGCSVVDKADCTAENTILGISDLTNAHTTAYNQTKYNYIFCCDDAYLKVECTGANQILKMSLWENAHVEIPEDSTIDNYPVDICYDNLVCTSRQNECNADEELLFSISAETNAHLAVGDYSEYTTKICCTSGVAPVTGNAYWADMNSKETNAADLGDSVKMVVKFENLNQGNYDINYSIYKTSDNGLLKIIRGIINAIAGPTQIVSARGAGVWKTDEEGEFYFKAEVISTGESVDSRDTETYGILTVNAEVNNNPPTTEIVQPEEQGKYIIDNSVSFEQISEDEDDDLNITWDIGDGVIKKFSNCLSGTNCNTTNRYERSGTKEIKLKAKEATRIQEDNDYATIFVYQEGINIFPYISEPEINQQIMGGRVVKFNGSGSYIANCTSFTSTNNCHAPSGVDCYFLLNETDDKVLTCFNYPKTNEWLIGNNKNYIFCFNWTIESLDGSIALERFGSWEEDYDSAVEFEQSLMPGQYFATLNVGYDFNTDKTCYE